MTVSTMACASTSGVSNELPMDDAFFTMGRAPRTARRISRPTMANATRITRFANSRSKMDFPWVMAFTSSSRK